MIERKAPEVEVRRLKGRGRSLKEGHHAFWRDEDNLTAGVQSPLLIGQRELRPARTLLLRQTQELVEGKHAERFVVGLLIVSQLCVLPTHHDLVDGAEALRLLIDADDLIDAYPNLYRNGIAGGIRQLSERSILRRG